MLSNELKMTKTYAFKLLNTVVITVTTIENYFPEIKLCALKGVLWGVQKYILIEKIRLSLI